MLRRLIHRVDEKVNVKLLVKIMLLLLILYLLQETDRVWGSWVTTLISILKPFLIGFVVAYVLHPLIEFLQEHKIKSNLAVIIVLLGFIVVIILLMLVLIPLLYDKILEFGNSLIYAVQWIIDFITTNIETDDISIVNTVGDYVTNFIKQWQSWLPQVTNALPSVFNSLLSVFSTIAFSLIIGIYMLFDFDRIKNCIRKIALMLMPHSEKYISEIDMNLTVYLKSLVILMVIKFFEYGLLYFLVGHNDWMIVALLTSIGLIIPYFGSTVANCIGILTGLTLSPIRFICLCLGIVVLSSVDGYVIGPLVHQKRSALGPLISLFAVFAGGIVAGIWGITLAVPVALCIRSIIEVYSEEQDEEHA